MSLSLRRRPRPPRPLGRAAALAAATALSGCVLDWEKPEATVETPPAFKAAKTARSAPPIRAAREWSQAFGSPELTRLVEKALEQNLDIAAAVARIQQADATARINSSPLWPSLTMNDIARRTQTPATITSATSTSASTSATTTTGAAGSSLLRTRRANFLQLQLDASYEIDFWGKNQDASNAARLLAHASRFDRDVVEISTIASVVNAYFQVLTAEDRLRIARNNIKIAETVLRAIKARLDVGTATALDFSQQDSVVAQQRASVPPLEQSLRQTKNTLAVLLGAPPESSVIKGGSLTRLRFPKVSPGLPSELLLRRPDIAEAEARLESAEFSVLQARASFFPSIKITGYYGVQSVALRSLFRPEAIAWQIAGNLTQPLFDGYNLQGQYLLQQGKYAELAQTYQKQILTAFADVENALIAIQETSRQLKLQGEAAAAARRAYEVAEARLREGTIDIITLSTTETTLFQTEDALAQVRFAYFQAATSLYSALGGGWSGTTRALELATEDAAYESDKGPWP
ncbi:efflux transporter outer membrane subunit [Methylosinus sp. H3A]|uniref:efflux transporter outer membrane subunit n=1 Tax=Methylosinus sp. H3A TaxID=2785786 RepID=UPI0018C25CB7|nr:efflux transporter outer membrane subunit [Methylosinus sp. H3A]MBG0811098.1 efflux transporter outer membrane subunit [Methylosinus sp. H3A]